MTVTTDETGNEGTVEVTEQPPEEKESDAKGNEGSGLEKDTEEEENKRKSVVVSGQDDRCIMVRRTLVKDC